MTEKASWATKHIIQKIQPGITKFDNKSSFPRLIVLQNCIQIVKIKYKKSEISRTCKLCGDSKEKLKQRKEREREKEQRK